MKQFGSFILDPDQSRLLHKASLLEVEIDHKVFELLSLFVQQPNIIISRQTLLDNLWAGSIVTDNAINKLIGNLRKVLGDDAKQPEYIQTIPKRGYRLICEVTILDNVMGVKARSSDSTPIELDKNVTVINKNPLTQRVARYSIISLFLVFGGLSIWRAFSDEGNFDSSYSVALTRASGAEQSAQMHPDSQHLYYLKNNDRTEQNTLWVMNVNNSITKQADIGSARISDLVALIKGESDTTTLLYLDKNSDSCGVYNAVFSVPSYVIQSNEKLFDCSDKRIKDIAYNAQQHTIYYTAQPKDFWPNQVYAFNLHTNKQILITQAEPQGWGHHNIDVSPDGKKLLIMSTNSNYKTQALSLNLLSNKIIEGVEFSYPVTEAIWHHDSQQIYYYAPAPSQQIIRSEFNGNNATTVISVSEVLSSKMSRLADGKNLLISTEQKNINNRWLLPHSYNTSVDNSTVADTYPGLFHHSDQYLFISKRSGRNQLYLTDSSETQAKIVTNFFQPHWLGYLVVSYDDKSVLLNVDNKIYLLSINLLNVDRPISTLEKAQLVYTSQTPIISLDWLAPHKVAVTTVNNANPELITINLSDLTIERLKGQWSYGLSDSQNPNKSYLIEQDSNILYRINSIIKDNDGLEKQYKFNATHISLPRGFYHVKVDGDILYYVTTEENKEYLHSVPLSSDELPSRYPINAFSSYDVSNGNIMVSDVEKLEGDVHRTVFQ